MFINKNVFMLAFVVYLDGAEKIFDFVYYVPVRTRAVL